jgi:hypothetical protein
LLSSGHSRSARGRPIQGPLLRQSLDRGRGGFSSDTVSADKDTGVEMSAAPAVEIHQLRRYGAGGFSLETTVAIAMQYRLVLQLRGF